MPEFDAYVTRSAQGTTSRNVLDHGRPILVLSDIPGPDGIPLMNTPWQLFLDDTEVASGVTDSEGRVIVRVPLKPDKVYRLEYPGRSVEIGASELEDVGSTKGMQQRLALLGYDPGPSDGISGPLTESALMEFQKDYDLLLDGIYGPESKAKILEVHGW